MPNALRLAGFAATMDSFDDLLDALGESEYAVVADVEYAVYVEYGTSKMQAQPYLRPAAESVMGSQASRILQNADDLDTAVKQLAEAIADKASDRAPVDTGRLQRSITVEKQG